MEIKMIRRKRFQAKVAISALNKVPCKNLNETTTAKASNVENNEDNIDFLEAQSGLPNCEAKSLSNVLPYSEIVDKDVNNDFQIVEKELIENKIINLTNTTETVLEEDVNNTSVNNMQYNDDFYNIEQCSTSNTVEFKTSQSTSSSKSKPESQNLVAENLIVVDESNLSKDSLSNTSCDTNDLTNGSLKEFVGTSSVKIYKKKRTALMNQELNTKKFTLADLITWKPKTENTLRKKWDLKREKFLENINNSDEIELEKNIQLPSTSNTVKKNIGPRVKINENGEMVLDEESLIVVNEPQTNFWETVDDDLMPKKLNSMSFRRNYSKTINWSKLETDLFYEVLSATGTDFGLMHEFIPGRTRAEIKRKFTKEEKVDLDRIEQTLENPTILDETLYERINRIKKKMEKELEEKVFTKLKPLRQRGRRQRKNLIEREDDLEID